MLTLNTEIEIKIAELKKRILEGKERCITAGEKIFGPEYSKELETTSITN